MLRFDLADGKPKPTLGILGIGKVSDEESLISEDPGQYRATVGCLIYVMTSTRPDLCHVVTKLSQKMSKSTKANLDLAKHVLRYLKGTSSQGLSFRRSNEPLKLSGFCDSDWGVSVDDR